MMRAREALLCGCRKKAARSGGVIAGNARRWQQLPAQRKLQLRWEMIPDDVARSMAFEGEPVPVETIREALSRIEPPAMLKPATAFLATRN